MFTAPHNRGGALPACDARYQQIERFYAAYGLRLLRQVTATLGDRALAEDGCQSAWVALLGHRQIPCDGRGLAWLRVVAVRAAWRASRAREVPGGSMAGGEVGEREFAEPVASSRGPLERVMDVEATDAARARLRGLPLRERRAVALYGAGLSYVEIAETTGDSVRTVERQLGRARRRLRP
jgi:RNA polymerase sigma factor (sigma-70 family)